MAKGNRGGQRGKLSQKNTITPNGMSFEERVYRARWTFERDLTDNERYLLQISDAPVLERETEKAVLVRWNNDYGSLKKWIPKSAISDEAMKRSLEYDRQRQEKKNAGKEKYNKLVQFAKNNVSGVRDRMKTSTILKKLRQAGITVPENLR